jgi:hypothetical protein
MANRPKAADQVFDDAAPVKEAAAAVVEPVDEGEDSAGVETEAVPFVLPVAVEPLPVSGLSSTELLIAMEYVVGKDIGTMDVSSPPCLPFDVPVPVVTDVHDIDAIGMAVTEPVAVPEAPVAAKDQVAMLTDVLTSPTCAASTVAADAATITMENFMLDRSDLELRAIEGIILRNE